MVETETSENAHDGDAERYDPNPTERGRWVSALVALLGAWLIVEPFLFGVGALDFWNDVSVGVALVALGGYNYYRRADERLASTVAAGAAALVGLWLASSPFAYGLVEFGDVELVTQLGFWNDVVVGLLVVGLAAYSVYEIRDTTVPRGSEA